MRYLFILLTPYILFASQINIKIDNNVSLETMKSSVRKGFIIEDEVIKEDLDKKVLLANKFIKNLTDAKNDKIKFLTIKSLSDLETNEILNKEKINVTDEIAYSYYLANKDEKYTSKGSVDLAVLTFDDKKQADSYSLDSNKTKPKDTKFYNKLSLDDITPNFLLAILNLEKNTLSDTLVFNKNYIRVYYTQKDTSGYKAYNEVKEDIINYLVGKNQEDLINKALGK